MELRTRVYIAGPMRGHPLYNFRKFFYWHELMLRSGYKVINPAAIDVARMINGWQFTEDKYEEVLAYDCDVIQKHADWLFVLHGWRDSVGAKREITTAAEAGIPVYYEEDKR